MHVHVAGDAGMHVFAADPSMAFSPSLEDCSSIEPRVERVIEFIRLNITLAFPASTNRINALIEAVLYIEKMKGYPCYQVRRSRESCIHRLLTCTFSARHGLAKQVTDCEEDPR
jgi:hypothetical protein